MILSFINIRKVPREGWKPRVSPSFFNTSLETLRMLMNRKSCLIPLLLYGTKSRDFWPTIRPFLTNKGSQNSDNIAISENGKIHNDTSEICEKFNSFFVNVAKNIGNSASSLSLEDHPSIRAIRANAPSVESEFEFQPVDEAQVSRYPGRIGQRKETGLDGLSSKKYT